MCVTCVSHVYPDGSDITQYLNPHFEGLSFIYCLNFVLTLLLTIRSSTVAKADSVADTSLSLICEVLPE